MKNTVKRAGKTALFLTRGAIIAAMYIALTHLANAFGLASGVIQVRISEAMAILPLFFPEAIAGLTLGCFIANLTTGAVVWDIIFGSFATLLGAVGAYLMRNIPEKIKSLATLPTIISNTVIVPFVLIYAYGAEGGYPLFLLTVFVGEVISAGILGSLLYYSLRKFDLGGKI